MLGLARYYFFNPSFLKFYTFSSTLSGVNSTYKILRENRQDCVFSCAVSICAWRRKTERKQSQKWNHDIYICSLYLEKLLYTPKDRCLLTP
jgi:hypothetical protein